MTFLDTVWTGLHALRRNRVRSALTMLGIVIGVGAVICMMSIGMGAQSDVLEKIRTLGTNLLLVKPGTQISGAARLEAGTAHTLTEDDAKALRREIRGVQIAGPLLSRSVHLVAGDKNWTSLVAGVSTDYLVAREWNVREGRAFTADEAEAGSKVAIIGLDIAEQLFDGRSALGETLRIGQVPFTVIAVLNRKGRGPTGISQDDVVFVPLYAAQSRVLGAMRGASRSSLDFIIVKVSDHSSIPDVANDISTLLRQRHRLMRDMQDDFNIQNPADVLTAHEGATRTLGILLISVASVSLAVGGISIMNILLVSVAERTREIGLRMAVGARRSDIRRQFMVESVVLAVVGGLFGSLAGSIAAAIIGWQAHWPVLISPLSVFLACGFSAVVGIAFGIYPAHRASNLDPIVALHSE